MYDTRNLVEDQRICPLEKTIQQIGGTMAAPATKKASPVLGFDPEFGQRLAGEEPYRSGDSGDGFIDERFGGLVSESRTRLRDALPKMIEDGGRDPEIARLLKEAGIECPTAPSVVHLCGAQFQVFFDRTSWRATGTLDGMKYSVTATDREQLLGKLIQLAQRVEAERIHELTEGERLQVVRLAQGGDITGAIALFCELAIGQERASQYASPNEMLADTALTEVFDEAAALTWFAARPKVQDSEQFQRFLHTFRGGRPLTHDLLDGAEAAFQEAQYKNTPLLPRTAKEEPATPLEIQAGLEEMSDEQLNKQYWSTVKAIKKFPGALA